MNSGNIARSEGGQICDRQSSVGQLPSHGGGLAALGPPGFWKPSEETGLSETGLSETGLSKTSLSGTGPSREPNRAI